MSDKPKDDAPVIDAPTIISDEKIWDFDKLEHGMLQNLGAEPIDAKGMTKTEYMRLLNARGLRMKNQQESTNGPELAPIVDVPAPKVDVPLPDLTDGHVAKFAAIRRVWEVYGVAEELWCDACFERRGFYCGARVRWGANGCGMSIRCHCGVRRHICQTDTSFTRTSTITSLDFTTSDITDAYGQHVVPTIVIQDQDATLILRYMHALSSLKLKNGLRCVGCSQSAELKFSDEEIVILCQCRNRYWKGRVH